MIRIKLKNVSNKCKSCVKSFSHPANLKRHKNTVHQGKKDHECYFCGKSFSNAANLE